MKTIASLFCISVIVLLSDLVFAQPEAVAKIAFELIDNRIFLDVYLNGSGPFKMILDSNSSSLTVNPELALKLHLPLLNPTPCGGAGAGQQTCYDTHISSATVAGIKTRVEDASVVPDSAISQVIGFQRFDGVLGVHFFEEHVLKFDYQNRQIAIYSSTADFFSTGQVVQLIPDRDYSEFLAVQASIDGKSGLFAIDTGDRSNLTVFKPFSDSSHVRDLYPNFISTVTGQGVNGPINADVLRLNQFEISGAQFEHFPSRFPPAQVFSSEKMSGSIGNGLLKAFNFFFDYPHSRLILLSRNGKGYQRFDRSGLWLTGAADRFLVGDVVVGSPASNLGLKVGDLIVNVDGRSTSSISLPSFRERLSDPNVSWVKITVKRKDKLKTYKLRLANLI